MEQPAGACGEQDSEVDSNVGSLPLSFGEISLLVHSSKWTLVSKILRRGDERREKVFQFPSLTAKNSSHIN